MDKSPDAFRTISEVAEVLDTPAHVLRFWESRFPQIRPVKRAGGRRYYRPSDVALLSGIKRLLHNEGLTIRGVQKILRDQGARHVAGLADGSLPFEMTEEDALDDLFEEDMMADDLDEAPIALDVPPIAAPLMLGPEQRALPLLMDRAQPDATPRPPRDDATLASLIRACPVHAMRDRDTLAALARRLAALRQAMVDRAEGVQV